MRPGVTSGESGILPRPTDPLDRATGGVLSDTIVLDDTSTETYRESLAKVDWRSRVGTEIHVAVGSPEALRRDPELLRRSAIGQRLLAVRDLEPPLQAAARQILAASHVADGARSFSEAGVFLLRTSTGDWRCDWT